MKKPLLICAAAGLLSFYLSVAKAQTDTTRYDLGRLQIKKSLTQAITIKAADLEKMPFTNLSDAINVWLYGVYGGAAAYVPVIDGIVMTDVNALSIYDIDEITLVQNSAVALNGATPQQLLLLIKTRRNREGKHGIEVAGQSNLATLHNTPANNSYTVQNTSKLYNQYYLSGYVNTSGLHAGLSADYQRDAMPTTKLQPISGGEAYTNGYAQTLNRYKFNGYLDADLGKSSVLSISTGYVPQAVNVSGTSASGYTITSLTSQLKENLYYSNISLKTALAGFQNTLTGGYEHYKNTINQDALEANYSSTSIMLAADNKNTASSYVIKDNLSYLFKAGDWEIEPNINLMYRHYKDTTYQSTLISSGSSAFSGSEIGTSSILKGSLLTPALNINYGRILALQGGFEVMLSNPGGGSNGYKPKKTYPFASVMLNVTELSGKENSSTGLSIFGSYASSDSYTTDMYNVISDINQSYSFSLAPTANVTAGNIHMDPYKAVNQWQAGTTLSMLSGKLIFNYTYSARSFNVINSYSVYDPYYGNYNYYYILPGKLITHRFGFDINWVKSSKLSWQTNLNASYIKTQFNYPDNIPGLYGVSNITLKGHIITGGLVNRVTFKKLFVGADVLYLFHENAPYTGSNSSPYYNAFNLQNIYAGFKFNLPGTKNLEVFANARSIAEDRSPTLLDTRKYYGLGFKLGI